MRRDVIETIAGVEIFPLISLVIFVGFFIGMLYWVVKLDDSYLNNENQPLDEDSSVADSDLQFEDFNGEQEYGKR